jgi:uncharacterized protein YjbJ (UPF0337 family)
MYARDRGFPAHTASAEVIMKDSSKRKLKAKVLTMKGTVKEAVGKVTNDTALRAEGVADKIAGRVGSAVADIEKSADK